MSVEFALSIILAQGLMNGVGITLILREFRGKR
jgi:hypothetical protein